MLLDAIGWIFFGFGSMRLVVACVNLFSRPYLGHVEASAERNVSVLIPARNEEHNIILLLNDLLAANDDVMVEIIVYDDRSSDGTAHVVERVAASDRRVKLIRGDQLPYGWIGKNYACYRLAAAAAGDTLLFLDADVRLRPHAISRAATALNRYDIDLLSVFPVQLLNGFGTKISVPLMNWILLSLLPLVAVRLMPQPSLAAANGQFMMFRASAYNALRPHLVFKNSPVEDMSIITGFKRHNRPVATLLGYDDVSCRMYTGFDEAVAGFAKNVFRFFGGSVVLSFAFAIVTTAAPIWIFLFIGTRIGIVYLFIIVLIRLAVSVASRQNPIHNILLMPFQQVVLWVILCRAFAARRNKFLTWKGRNIYS